MVQRSFSDSHFLTEILGETEGFNIMPRVRKRLVSNHNRRPKVCICPAPVECPLAAAGAVTAEDGNTNITVDGVHADFEGMTPIVEVQIASVSRTASSITAVDAGAFDFIVNVAPTNTQIVTVQYRMPNGCSGNATGQTTN